jgi:carbonic anhydrase
MQTHAATMQTKPPSSDPSETAGIDPLALFDLGLGDAHVIRNAGGLVTPDAIRSLAASQRLLDTNEIAVVMHDKCGLHGASDADFADTLAADGATPDWPLGAFADLEQTLREGVERLRASPELPYRESIRGFIFDPETGRVRELAVAGPPPRLT